MWQKHHVPMEFEQVPMFKPAMKTKSLQIHLLGDIARQLATSV